MKSQIELVKSIRFTSRVSTASRVFKTKKDKSRTRRALKLRLEKEGW